MTDNDPNNDANKEEEIPFMQKLLDNSFLLLFIGILIPTVTYLIWGIMELVSIPVAP